MTGKPMKRLRLVRAVSGEDRTFGQLYDGPHFVCHTMEPGDSDVQAPRVEPGWYGCEPHGWEPGSGAKFRSTWALVGRDVSHFPEPGVKRSAVLFHAGNLDHETRGCILVGMSVGTLQGEPALFESRAAMDALRDRIGHERFWLAIEERG